MRSKCLMGVAQVYKNTAIYDALAQSSFTKSEWDKLTGISLWSTADRSRMRAALDTALFVVPDLLGIPRVKLPAEYIASAICCFVSSSNWMIACHWYDHSTPVNVLIDEYAETETGTFDDNISASRLYALVCLLATEQAEYVQEIQDIISSRLTPRPVPSVVNEPVSS